MKYKFNSDGSLNVSETVQKSNHSEDFPHTKVIQVLLDLPYSVGKKYLSEILRGAETDRIKKSGIQKLELFGALCMYDDADIYNLIAEMMSKGFIKVERGGTSGFLPLLVVTPKGKKELESPEDIKRPPFDIDEVTDTDREVFKNLGYLEKYNDEQKKGIVSPASKLLCIAGAGSGKTTVLTKRIEFLVKYKGVPAEKILAITFTRKARVEMMQRLERLMPGNLVRVDTFNSFSEKILQKNEIQCYGKNCRVLDFSSKIKLVTKAMNEVGFSTAEAIELYFSKAKQREKDQKDLFFNLIGDIFSLIDHFKNNNQPISQMQNIITQLKSNDRIAAQFMFSVIQYIEEFKKEEGFRDYTDQIVHTLEFFDKHSEIIPEFEHVLVDEYQDVNDIQIRLIKKLNSPNLFVVGDPRQSIYGWRGSKIDYIYNFKEEYTDAKIVQLTKNYRSNSTIVNASNEVIRNMDLPDLVSANKEGKNITFISHNNEMGENEFVAQSIISQTIDRKNIFILGRTNRQLRNIANTLDRYKIQYLIRTMEDRKTQVDARNNQVTLSTVHAIKGLEAELVYLIGVNANMYPCQAREHPVLDLVKSDTYDKYEEERRLLYVAMTRAKQQLVINSFNTPSSFLTIDVKKLFEEVKMKTSGFKNNKNADDSVENKLRSWRYAKSQELGIKPYMIFSDKTMHEICESNPMTKIELLEIYGMADKKVQRYGQDILDIVQGIL
jgi:superfamily I DNA/RNA helicase